MTKARELAELGAVYDSGALSNRNLIINGAMQVDQRGTNGSPITVGTSTTYGVDRFCGNRYGSATGVFTLEQETVSTLDDFRHITRATVTTADAAPASTYGYSIRQVLEGFVTAPLKWGFSNPKTVTLSFWVRSSVAGLYSATIMDSNAYNNTQGYTINSPNTWEHKTISFSGPTSYNTNISNGAGAYVIWGLGAGSSRTVSDSGDTWNSNGGSTPTKVTGGVDWIATLSATFDITGVQLEVGESATPFEHRSYGDELARCQRYYQIGTYYFSGQNNDTARNSTESCEFRTKMRSSPTITNTNTNQNNVTLADSNGQDEYRVQFRWRSSGTSDFGNQWNWTADAEL